MPSIEHLFSSDKLLGGRVFWHMAMIMGYDCHQTKLKGVLMKEKILLDTDIGSDIDDAVCLAYLLMQPDCELLGVTTVTGESKRRASMVDALCQRAGKSPPIIPGIETPLLVASRQPSAQQAVRLKNWPHREDFPDVHAIPFLAETILAHPGEVTLLAVGPLTNIGLLFAMYPETAKALKQLVLMCGVFTDAPTNLWPREWNAILDPHATRIVYQSGVAVHKSVGLDVTQQVKLSWDAVRSRFNHPILEPVLDFAAVWFEEQDWLVFHDPLAAVSIFDSQICRFERGLVTVATDCPPEEAGTTTFVPQAETGPHQVALEVDPDGFFESFFSVFQSGL